MAKLLTKGMMGILLLGMLGVFTARIYQQRAVLGQLFPWLISGRYLAEGVNSEKMQQYQKIKDLNGSIPPLAKIYHASSQAGGMEGSDIDLCQHYYHLVLADMPQLQEAHIFLGFCAYKGGDDQGAFAEFRQGLPSGTGVFWSSYNLGVLALMSGNKDAAEILFLQAAKLPLEEILKNILSSRLFEQYMQANDLTPQDIWQGLNEAREGAIEALKIMEDGHPSTSPFKDYGLRIRIF